MPLIITGARGRLGDALARYFTKNGREVIRVSRTQGQGIIAYSDLFQSNLFRADTCIIHCAWGSLPRTAEQYPATVWMEDLPLLARILQTIATAPVEERPFFIYPSSGGAVYGNGTPDQPHTENDPLHPISWYGYGKVAAEEVIRAFTARAGVKAAILRVSNPYGFAYDPAKPQGIIAAALNALRTGRALEIWGNGGMTKDFLHLDDLCTAFRLAADQRLDGVWNVSSGQSTSINELLALIEQTFQGHLERTLHPALAWDVQASHLSPARFQTATGWAPTIALTEGIRIKEDF